MTPQRDQSSNLRVTGGASVNVVDGLVELQVRSHENDAQWPAVLLHPDDADQLAFLLRGAVVECRS